MPVFAFLVGLGGLAVWLGVLALPLVALVGLVALVAMLFGAPFNGGVGMGVAVTLLPAIVYVPVVFFSFLLPAISQLIAHLIVGLFTKDGFSPQQAMDLIAGHRRKSLAVFGIRRRAGRTRG